MLQEIEKELEHLKNLNRALMPGVMAHVSIVSEDIAEFEERVTNKLVLIESVLDNVVGDLGTLRQIVNLHRKHIANVEGMGPLEEENNNKKGCKCETRTKRTT